MFQARVGVVSAAALMLIAGVAHAGPVKFKAAAVFAGGAQGPKRLAIGDFDGDGNADVVMANKGSDSSPGELSLFYGDGAGGFESDSLGVSYYPWGIVAANYDASACPELMVGDSPSPGGGAVKVHRYRTNCSRHFTQTGTTSAGGFMVDLLAADVNADGKNDLVVVNNIPTGTGVLAGDGVGGLSLTQTIASSSGMAGALGDLTGDSKPDLAVATYSGVELYKNNGAGSFTLAGSAGLGNITAGVAIADLDKDGKGDVVSAELYSARVIVNRGNGNGTVLGAVVYTYPGGSAGSLVVGDLDQDGYPDVIVSDGASVFVFMNAGDGTLETAREIELPQQSRDVKLGDFNNDGRLDIAVAMSQVAEGSLGVILQACVSDVNDDNVSDLADFFAFFDAFDQTQALADINADGSIDLADFFAFLNAFDRGC